MAVSCASFCCICTRCQAEEGRAATASQAQGVHGRAAAGRMATAAAATEERGKRARRKKPSGQSDGNDGTSAYIYAHIYLIYQLLEDEEVG